VLDIVMPAHVGNFKRMAHRSMAVTGRVAAECIAGSLPSIVNLASMPGKVVLSLEGGNRQDFEAAEAYLQEQKLQWQIIHNSEVTNYHQALLAGLAECRSPLVAVVPPWVEVKDPQWAHRMVWALRKDPSALLVGTHEVQGTAKDLAPYVGKPRMWPGGEFFVARREAIEQNIKLVAAESMHADLARNSSLNSWRIWVHPGVRFQTHEHEDHSRREEVGPLEDRYSGRQEVDLFR
jgi:hypothetical protein